MSDINRMQRNKYQKYYKGDKCPKIKLEAPIKIGQVVAKNLFGKKIDLMATRKLI